MSIHPSVGALLCALVLPFAGAASAQQYTVRDFVDYQKYAIPKISPDGRFIAMGIREAHTTRLVVVDIASRKVTLSTGFGAENHVNDFYWVSSTRLVFDTIVYTGYLDGGLLTGDLYAINYDGTGKATLWGPRVLDGTYADILNTLPDDDDHIIVAAYGAGNNANPPAPSAWRIDVNLNLEGRVAASHMNLTKRYKTVTSAAKNGQIFADNTGEVRVAAGFDEKSGADTLFYRDQGAKSWRNIGHLVAEDRDARVVGFTEDNKQLLLEINGPEGYDTLQLYDPATDTRKQLAGRKDVDITSYARSLDGDQNLIAGVRYDLTLPEREWLEKDDTLARLYRVVGAAFPADQVSIGSMTRDKKKAVVTVWNDRNPGDVYLLDTVSKKLEYIFSLREVLDPDLMGPMEHVAFKARDGLTIHGYLTLPKGKRSALPLVVLPHGGPHGIRDYYGFDIEAQMLAHHGYAVFQVNYRGSGGYGKPFEESGYRNWGTTMQDDLTDATLWAVEQGIADRARLCIYGGSYGGYAALQGAVREPDLYRCTVGYVGVYDIPLMFEMGDTHRSSIGRRYLRDFHGTDEADQRSRSPAFNAGRIKAEVMLVSGAQDQRVRIEHHYHMAKALDAVGKKYESMIKPLEGHGFAEVENRVEFYSKMLAFLQRNIGGDDTRTAAPDNPPKKK
jgi:dipeptidyl aminopeptidase/acylaminoacyl peptidase